MEGRCRMKSFFTIGSASIVFLAVLALPGCASSHRDDLASQGVVQVGVVRSASVEVAPPAVVRAGGVLIVSGTVTRKPGVDADLPGHIRILVKSSSGQVLHEMSIASSPVNIPTTGDRASKYELQSYYIPPAGATFTAEYAALDSAELASARMTGNGGNSSRGAGGGGSTGGLGSGHSVGHGH